MSWSRRSAVDDCREHLPDCCGCGHVFDGSEERVGDPVRHQQFELPVVRPLVFEHARVRLRCPACQKATLAALSAGAQSGFGSRVDAHIAMLAGVFRLSRDQVRQIVVEVFGIPASTGSIDNAIMRMSVLLADPWAELREAICRAQAVHAMRRRGGWLARSSGCGSPRRRWWRVFGSTRPAASRPRKRCLGEEFGGFVISDRYTGYHFLDVLQQQLCWCHVIRQLVEVSQRSGAAGRRGAQLVKLARQVIAVHREFLTDGHDADWLGDELGPLRSTDPCAARAVRRRPPHQDSELRQPGCWRSTRRCGRSPTSPTSRSTRPTTPQSAPSVTPC